MQGIGGSCGKIAQAATFFGRIFASDNILLSEVLGNWLPPYHPTTTRRAHNEQRTCNLERHLAGNVVDSGASRTNEESLFGSELR